MTDHIISREWIYELISPHVSDARKREIRDMVVTRPHTCTPIRSMSQDEEGYISWQETNEKALQEHDTAIRNATLQSLLQVVKIREDEMARKANLTENMTTANGYFTSAGALNWVVQEIEKSLRGEP